MKSIHKYILSFLLLMIFVTSCQENVSTIQNTFKFIEPKYELDLKIGSDTLLFRFPDTLYHRIKAFNIFKEGSKEYLAMFDRKQQIIFVYDLSSGGCVTQMAIKDFVNITTDYYTTSYVKSFDSIFIFDNKTVRLFDANRVLKKTISFINENPPQFIYQTLSNPPVFTGNKFYTGVQPLRREKSLTELKKQKLVYEFDMQNDSALLYYNLPDVYYSDYYSYTYLGRTFCLNKDGNFVFSFALDSNIYETNLREYNHAYYGKSRYQTDWVQPVSKEEVVNLDKMNRNYALNDAYGGIQLDEINNRYLRVAYRKMSERDYTSKTRSRQQSAIIFDQKFKIIGETLISNNIDLNRMFFTADGKMYALLENADIYSIQFVRLYYKDHANSKRLTKN